MGDKSKIEWTDATWNPVRGCTRVSQGCVNCYAEALAGNRLSGPGQPYEGIAKRTPSGPRWTGKVEVVEHLLDQPLRWRKPRRIFVNSMSDLFHESLSDEEIDRIFAVMLMSCLRGQGHVFQVLTKRAKRMREWATGKGLPARMLDRAMELTGSVDPFDEWPQALQSHVSESGVTHPNIWMGVSVENQDTAYERIPELLETPACVRWLSCEPLLGPIDINEVVTTYQELAHIGPIDIDWCVVGGESGANARPMHPDWARGIRDDCLKAGVPFFFKQWGEWGTARIDLRTGQPVFDQFRNFQHWVDKAPTWVNGGICLDADGKSLRIGADFHRARNEGKFPVTIMDRVGKKAAGRVLDGKVWEQWPEVSA